MKKNILLIASLLMFSLSFSQEENTRETDTAVAQVATLNNYRWRIEIGTGESRGLRPFSDGHFSSNSQKALGVIDINSFTVGATYTFSELLGFRLDFAFDRFKEKDYKSAPFEVAQFRMSLQAVMNLNSVLKYQKDTARLNFLFHAGFGLSTMQKVRSSTDPTVGSRELNGGVVVGFTPIFRIARRAHVYFDFSSFHNYRQHYTWDGEYSKPSNNLSGHMINGTFGISYSLGRQLSWKRPEIKLLEEQNAALEKRVGDLETMMNDTDKDGVADYLDNENNSVAGVAVDSRGVMVDINRNGVPDELERYFTRTYGEANSAPAGTDFLKRAINEGYITAFFETNNPKPNDLSLDGVHFVLIYLRANPSASIDITGYADEIGPGDKNEKLALARAVNVKKLLVESGIDPARINVVSAGEDSSADRDSTVARSLVRRVVFKLK